MKFLNRIVTSKLVITRNKNGYETKLELASMNLSLQWSKGCLNSWVVSHLALNISMLCHAVCHEFMTWWRQTLFQTQATSMLSSWLYLVYLIWYYYLSVKFVMWIVKQKIENKWNLFKKSLQWSKKLPDTGNNFYIGA